MPSTAAQLSTLKEENAKIRNRDYAQAVFFSCFSTTRFKKRKNEFQKKREI
jgi:hypothetical protein